MSTLTDIPQRRSASTILIVVALLIAAGLAALFLHRAVDPDGKTFWRTSHTKIHDLKRLRVGNKVALEGIVTFSDPLTRRFYFQDDTGALRVQRGIADPLPTPGTRVRVNGTLAGEYLPSIGIRSIHLDDLNIATAGTTQLPSAQARTLRSIFSEAAIGEFVRIETTGIVSAAHRNGDRLQLEIGDDGFRIPVTIVEAATSSPASYLDARVAVRGVIRPPARAGRSSNPAEISPPEIAVASLRDVTVLEPAPAEPATIASLYALISDERWVASGHRVRIAGTVVQSSRSQTLLIEDRGVAVPVEVSGEQRFAVGDRVEAIGWPAQRRFTVLLQRAQVNRAPQPQTSFASERSVTSLPVITDIRALRALTPEDASRAHPVRVIATLIAVHAQRDCYFLQMGSDGVYVDATGQDLRDLRPGQRVLVTGLTAPGGFAPVIVHPLLEVLGPATLPKPLEPDPELAPSGIYDSTWAQLEGLVRPPRTANGNVTFNLHSPLGAVRAQLLDSKAGIDDLSHLVDARVRVRGVFNTAFTNEGVLTGYRFFIDSMDDIEVLRAAPLDLATSEPRPVKSLLRFAGGSAAARRAHVRGVVTFNDAGSLYIEDESGSVHVQAVDSDARPGEIVDAIGYPTPSENGPILADATIRSRGEQQSLEPRRATPQEILDGGFDSRFVTLDARVLSQVEGASQQTLVLQAGYVTFNAELRDGTPMPHLHEGSLVNVSGICVVQRQQSLYREARSIPVSFRILLRSADDVRVLDVTPWWNLRHVWPALAALTLSICLAMLWVFILSRRVRAQTYEIDSQRTFLRQVIDLCPNFIFVKDRAGRFTLANRALADAYECRPEDMIGKTDSQIGVIEKEAHEYFLEDMRVMETREERIAHEESRTDLAGRKRWMHTVRRPLLGPNGTATHVLGVSNDITLHKQAEATLQKAREAAEAANRAKSEFLANMSHEIRTPLNGIIGMSELCLDTNLSAEQREYLETVKLSADGLLGVINDILDFSKIEAGKLELDPSEFELREVLEGALKTIALRAHQKGLELTCEVTENVPERVKGDANRLRQVILNLVGNAIKFTERGEVGLRVQLHVNDGNHCVLHFTVSDTGIGIAEDRQQDIFNPFAQADSSTTRQYGGTGLGLTISSRLANMMEGRMWVESALGQGSHFHFTVRFEAVDQSHPHVRTLELRPLESARLLVVDDNATHRGILERLLARWKMRVVAVESADEALAALSRAHDEDDPYRIVLADIDSGTGDELQLIERIRERRELAQPRVIMMTVSGYRQDAERTRKLAIDGYLMKPLRTNELRETLLRSAHPRAHAIAPAAQPAKEPVRSGRSLNILLAEDNLVNQVLMQRLLQKRGHTVHIAENGRAVLNALASRPFDLILMDVQMPELDGFETTAEIRRRETQTGAHIAIVALTAHAMAGDRERCLAAGMDGYLTKPIDPAELDETLRRYCEDEARPTVGSASLL